jgi:hypothetical protein
LGKFLAQKHPGETLALGPLGKISFFSDSYVMDMMGLADPVIAHLPVATTHFEPGHIKFDPDYILSRRPALIVAEAMGGRDLGLGLTQAKYEAAGYHLAYLANTRRPPPAPPIIAVDGLDPLVVANLIANGYDYAVLAKNQPR